MKNINLKYCLLIFALAFLLSSCMAKSPLPDEPDQFRTKMYVDANLEFTIVHPENWSRIEEPGIEPFGSSNTVHWASSPADPQDAEVHMIVTSVPPTQVPGGHDKMLEDFKHSNPGFVITEKERVDLAAAPALKVQGKTNTYNFLIFFITSSRRAYTLEFYTTSRQFPSYLPLFEKTAQSFKILPLTSASRHVLLFDFSS